MTKGHQPKGSDVNVIPEGGPPITQKLSGALPPVETDQTRAAEALEEQSAEALADQYRVSPRQQQDAQGEPEREPYPEIYELECGDKLDLVQHGKILSVVMCKGIPPDPALRLAPIYAALAQAQGAFPEIPKNRTATVRMKKGGVFTFKYSDLSDLIGATRPALTEKGLSVFQVPSDDLKTCITTLAHLTGLVLVGKYPIKHGEGEGRLHPGQDWAISWALARRYGMSALLGVAAEETVEGDKSEKTSEDFQSDGGDGILSVRGVVPPEGATKAEKAKLFATAIEGKLDEAATETGLEGVWSRNDEVINTLQDHYPDLHQNLLDVYKRCLDSVREGEG